MIGKGEEGKITGHATTCNQAAVAAMCLKDALTGPDTSLEPQLWQGDMIKDKRDNGTKFATASSSRCDGSVLPSPPPLGVCGAYRPSSDGLCLQASCFLKHKDNNCLCPLFPAFLHPLTRLRAHTCTHCFLSTFVVKQKYYEGLTVTSAETITCSPKSNRPSRSKAEARFHLNQS